MLIDRQSSHRRQGDDALAAGCGSARDFEDAPWDERSGRIGLHRIEIDRPDDCPRTATSMTVKMTIACRHRPSIRPYISTSAIGNSISGKGVEEVGLPRSGFQTDAWRPSHRSRRRWCPSSSSDESGQGSDDDSLFLRRTGVGGAHRARFQRRDLEALWKVIGLPCVMKRTPMMNAAGTNM